MYIVVFGTLNYKSDRQLSPIPVTIQEGRGLVDGALLRCVGRGISWGFLGFVSLDLVWIFLWFS